MSLMKHSEGSGLVYESLNLYVPMSLSPMSQFAFLILKDDADVCFNNNHTSEGS